MSGALWTSDKATAATGGRTTAYWEATGVSIDSRALAPGDLFVALRDARDGHDFVADAFRAGAAAAMVERKPDGLPAEAALMTVDDALAALGRLGATARQRADAALIAVTGSVGKTGVKEMLSAALEGSGPTHAAEKSYNNQWGVPLTLARMPRETRFAAIEIGMNHPGEIAPLSRLAEPDAAIVTTVEPVHMAAFDSVEAIADAKAEIFDGIKPGGPAILNADNPHFARLAEAAEARGARVIGFGTAEAAAARLIQARVTSAATVVKAELHGRPLVFKIGAPGRHLAMNAMAALAAVEAVGGDLARATLALSSWTPPEGRGSRWIVGLGEAGVAGEIELIDESYNANPASMRAALAVLAAAAPRDGEGRVERGRRLVFLGDMLELGPDEAAIHADLAGAEEMRAVDRVYCAGRLMKHLYDALPAAKQGAWFPDSEAMAASAGRSVDAGDAAMVKGSLGARMGVVVEALKGLGAARAKGGG